MHRTRRIALIAAASLLALSSCSSSDGEDQAAEEPTAEAAGSSAGSPSVDPTTVEVFTSQEVCDLVSADDLGGAVDGEVTKVSPRELSTPQCGYDFTTAEGDRANLSTSVQRPVEDLGGSAGEAGFDVATGIVIFDTPYVPLDGLGDQAAISESATFTQIVVLAGDQVLTVGGNQPVTADQIEAAAALVVAGIS
jgi:hypothetical protein